MEFRYRFSLVRSGEKWRVCVCVCLSLDTQICVSSCHGAVEINDPASCFIFPHGAETGRRMLRLPFISLCPQSFTGSTSLPLPKPLILQ